MGDNADQERRTVRVSLLGGAYSARSIIANLQRCANLFPETNPQETSPSSPVTHLPTPGLTAWATPGAASPVRCLHRTALGSKIVVIGNSVYASVGLSTTFQLMGTISSATGPVRINDNGIIGVIVDGSASGWWFKIALNGLGGLLDLTLHAITDPAWYGSTSVAYLDTYFIFNRPGSANFYVSPSYWDGTTALNSTWLATKTGAPDPIQYVEVVNGSLWLIGLYTTEVWFDSGGADFPFERQPGVYIEHGVAAWPSVCATDVELLLLGRDRDGYGVVFKTEGYSFKRVSTHALEAHWNRTGNVISDARGFSYQQGGHTFYQLNFPTLGETWVYDLATDQWHERTYTSGGVESRHRADCMLFDDKVFVGDYANGKIYILDPEVFTDDGAAITRTRTLPHVATNGKRLNHQKLVVDLDVSEVASGSQVTLKWSDDRGKTSGSPLTLTINDTLTSLAVSRLGMARDRVYLLQWTFPYFTALQGVWLDVEEAVS